MYAMYMQNEWQGWEEKSGLSHKVLRLLLNDLVLCENGLGSFIHILQTLRQTLKIFFK